jgi:hypothetical protein
MISSPGALCCRSSLFGFGILLEQKKKKNSSASQSEGSNLESIFTEKVSHGSVVWQARAGTVLALSIPVILPQFSFEITAEYWQTASFIKTCQYILIITFWKLYFMGKIFLSHVSNRELKDASMKGITFLTADTTFQPFCNKCII